MATLISPPILLNLLYFSLLSDFDARNTKHEREEALRTLSLSLSLSLWLCLWPKEETLAPMNYLS